MNRSDITHGQSSFPRIAQIALGVLVGGAYALFILQFQRPAPRIPERYEVSVNVGPASDMASPGQTTSSGQDIVIGMNNAVLYLPYDAISAVGTVSMIARLPNSFSIAGEEWNRPIIVDIEFRDESGVADAHLTLLKPAQLCFVLSPEGWQAYSQSPDDFQVQYYADEANPPRWEPLPLTAIPERYQLCGETAHLSMFGLAVRNTIVVPITGPTPMIYEVLPSVSATSTQTPLSTPTPLANTSVSRNTPTQTASPLPTSTPTPVPTNTRTPTQTPLPSRTPTPTPLPTNTPLPTDTPLPTNTPVPTATDVPTATEPPPTNTEPPPTNTDPPPTTEPPPTDTEPPPPTDPPTTEPPPPTDPPTTEPPPTDPPVFAASFFGDAMHESKWLSPFLIFIAPLALSGLLFLSAGWLEN